MARNVGLTALCVLIACAGCNRGPDGPETAPVSGYVSLNGAPLAGADVFFHPVTEEAGVLTCQAVTDKDGRFAMSTHIGAGKYKPGMVPGEYRVAISKLDASHVATTFTAPKNTLPEKYASPQTSGFTATVSLDNENDFDFPLQD